MARSYTLSSTGQFGKFSVGKKLMHHFVIKAIWQTGQRKLFFPLTLPVPPRLLKSFY